jgi:hypothetical protein
MRLPERWKTSLPAHLFRLNKIIYDQGLAGRQSRKEELELIAAELGIEEKR